MKIKHLLVFAALAANTLQAAETPIPQDSAVVIRKLDNGLTYILRHNEYPKQRADFYIVQKVGAVLEEDSQDGLAHFLEHMAFNGTKNFPDKGIIEYLETVGVRFGANLNAYTSMDQTVYLITNVPTTRQSVVDSALLVLHDWSGFISLRDSEIDKERGVIREEWRTSKNASRRMYYKHIENISKGTPYAVRDVLGDTAVINNFAYDDLRNYYHKWYRPDLQGVIVVGDVDVDYVEKKIAELWQDIPAHENPAERIYHELPKNETPIASVVTDPEATSSSVVMRFRFPALSFKERTTEEGYAYNLALNLLNSCLSRRLDELTNQANCVSSGAGSWIYNESPLTACFSFQADAKLDSTSQTIDFLLQEVERMRRFGVTSSELQLAKTSVLANYENKFRSCAKRENSSYVSEYCDVFLDNDATPGIGYELELVKKYLADITLMDLNLIADALFDKNVILMISAPTSDEGVPTEEELIERYNKSRALALDPPKDNEVDAPLVDHTPTPGTIVKATPDALFGAEEWILSNGVKVFLKPTPYADNSISITAQSYGGRAYHDPSKMPSFDLYGYLFQLSGLGNHSLNDLQRILTGKIVNMRPQIGADYEKLSGSSSKADFETALQLAYLIFQPMRFDPNAFDVVMSGAVTELANAQKNPQKAFNDTITQIVANNNPFNNPVTLKNIGEVKHQDIVDIHNARFANAADFTFYIVGDFSKEEVRKPILTWLGGIATKPEREAEKKIANKYPSGIVRNTFEREMNISKTSAFVAYSGNQDYSYRSNNIYTVLGRLLYMRYLETIREDEGGSYGVACEGRMSKNLNQFYLLAQFDTDPSRVADLLPIIEREIKIIADNGPKLDDLAKVKENMKKSHAESIETNGYWSNALINKTMWNIDLFTGFAEMIDSITPDDIKAAAAACIEQGNKIEVMMNPK